MKVSILHIADLHRDPGNPISNAVLLDSLRNDHSRYSTHEDPPVRSPDLIIVSGDIVQGAKPDAPNPEATLQKQYREALAFLRDLTDVLVGGDRNRVIVVPGNHDVSAYHFLKSLRPIDIAAERKRDLVTQLFVPGSSLRWSWSEFGLYEIADPTLYAQRLAAFAYFYKGFYQGARTYDLDPEKQFDIFDYPAYDVTIAAFSSCYNNDVFNKQGAIHPTCIASAATQLRQASYQNRLRIGVWHHDAHGVPGRSDYMDADLLQNLIDRGFSLGFHGHQHRPEFLDTRFQHGAERKIRVISAGTLCGSASFRYGRAYNVLELDIEKRTGRLHVREMQNDNLSLPIWGPRALPPNTSAFYDFEFDPPPEPTAHSDLRTIALFEAQRVYESGDYQRAAEVLVALLALEPLARPLLLDCFVKLKDHGAVIATFDPPKGDAEVIHLLDALWAEGKRARLAEVLNLPIIAESKDPSVVEVRAKFRKRLGT